MTGEDPDGRGSVDSGPAEPAADGGFAGGASDAAPARDAGTEPMPPPPRSEADFGANVDDSDAEEVRRQERRDDVWLPEDRITPVVPLVDAGPGPDAGDDDAAQGM